MRYVALSNPTHNGSQMQALNTPSPDSGPTMPSGEAAPRIHVAIVEDDLGFRSALARALLAAPDMKLAGTAGTKAEGIALLQGPPVDVLLVDLGLPDGSGIEVIRAAARQWPSCSIMVSTNFGDETHVMRSIEAGPPATCSRTARRPRSSTKSAAWPAAAAPSAPSSRARCWPGFARLPLQAQAAQNCPLTRPLRCQPAKKKCWTSSPKVLPRSKSPS
jgi:CheY-like chemotaxis protein